MDAKGLIHYILEDLREFLNFFVTHRFAGPHLICLVTAPFCSIFVFSSSSSLLKHLFPHLVVCVGKQKSGIERDGSARPLESRWQTGHLGLACAQPTAGIEDQSSGFDAFPFPSYTNLTFLVCRFLTGGLVPQLSQTLAQALSSLEDVVFTDDIKSQSRSVPALSAVKPLTKIFDRSKGIGTITKGLAFC
jgi:hypothetical protein